MKKLNALLLVSTLLAGAVSAHAASHAGAPTGADAKKETTMAAPADMADGEVRKVDTDNKKITIKHGVIKNLDMPGMTMVFQVKDAALLGKVKVGDKIRFKAEKSGSSFAVTDIELAQ